MIVHKPVIVFVLSLVLTGLSACSPRAVREAQDLVRTADSLRAEGKMYGIDEGDSATLAQAYEILKPFAYCPSSLSTSFTHACYHYGRLLREKDNPVAAMECFINASHARTRDYHILGRVYSNMGDLCHLAGEYQLAYDMYQRSADMFLQDGDTLMYYYDLNNMAFEVAEQGKREETLVLLNTIDNLDSILLSSIHLTKAELYKKGESYDSAIHYANMACHAPQHQLTKMLIKAQSYSYMKNNDSAVYYANEIILHTDELFYINSALYILTHEDNKKDIEEVRNISAERSDTQKLIEIRQGKLSQAVQLLEQDRNRKPDYRWLLTILVTLVIVGASIYTYVYRKRRQHTLLSQKVEDLTIQNREAETQHEKIINDFEKHKRTIADEIERNCHLIKQAKSFPKNIYWNKYNKMCSIVDKQYYLLAAKLHTKYKLTETETRLCVLTLLDCKYDQIADLLFRSRSSIGTLKIRVARKIGTTAKNLRMYLIENECIS